MKMTTLFIPVIVAALAAAVGYQWGKKQQPAAVVVQADGAKAERKILYYRNPMGLPDTSPVPKQDSMGMDYVAVYDGEDAASKTIPVSAERMQLLGVKTEAAQLRQLTRTLRVAAAIEVDERKLQVIAPRFEGWVRQLHVNSTGQTVTQGQALLTVYSPELQSAKREYQLALESGQNDLAQSALQRLRNWEVASGATNHATSPNSDNLVLRSPINGVVLEKIAVAGARFAPGEVLFKLADLSTVWVQAEVAEQDQGVLRVGQPASVTVDAYPGTVFTGKVSFISPVLNPQTRTVRVRVELSNRDGRLRPAMFASVQLSTQKSSAAVLAIPASAVIDSGARQVVLVQIASGRFAPREVKLGQRTDDYIEVLEGIMEGEQIVTRANFLLDAESNLRAALGGMAQSSVTAPAPMEHHHDQ